jgi:hypothetical protein
VDLQPPGLLPLPAEDHPPTAVCAVCGECGSSMG